MSNAELIAEARAEANLMRQVLEADGLDPERFENHKRFDRLADALEAAERYTAKLHGHWLTKWDAVCAERDRLATIVGKVRKYAEEREAYGRQARTVGSARIASDLFNILGEHRGE